MGRPALTNITFRRPTRDVPRLTVSESARFWARVRKQKNGCWLWQGATGYNGYGSFYIRNVGTHRAHRISWGQVHGEVPLGFDLDHGCRKPRCVNPDHMELTTPRVNYWRRDGRYWAQEMGALLERVKNAEGDIDQDTFTSNMAQELLGLSRNRLTEACNFGELNAYMGPPVTKGYRREQWYIPRVSLYVFIINRAAEDSGLHVLRALIGQQTGERLSLHETLARAAKEAERTAA
ncbi:HNH endonuclease signature motif containing protein [Mycolicibacterium smegmatis]|uniref:HNH endonuclease signature motif containing protein n=1 Tax=Mycolicibacterium smegmatis TaxID=1772 RepID=UPI0020A52403|nr:HNH endonuclease signature motif containing protein [Mycolicibacterium smegmatis]